MTRRCSSASAAGAKSAPTSPSARPSSSASPARPRRISTICSSGSRKPSSTASARSSSSPSKARRRTLLARPGARRAQAGALRADHGAVVAHLDRKARGQGRLDHRGADRRGRSRDRRRHRPLEGRRARDRRRGPPARRGAPSATGDFASVLVEDSDEHDLFGVAIAALSAADDRLCSLDPGRPRATREALHLVDKSEFEDWVKTRPAEDRRLLAAQRFTGKAGVVLLPRGDAFEAVAAVKDRATLGPWAWQRRPRACPRAPIAWSMPSPARPMLGWLLAQHRFDPYRAPKDAAESAGPRVLLTSEPARIQEHGSPRRGDRARCATWSTRRPPTSVPPSSSGRCASSPRKRSGHDRSDVGPGPARRLSADRGGRAWRRRRSRARA